MVLQQVKLVNFGSAEAGLTTVGFALFDSSGIPVADRTITGVYELSGSTGIYGALATFPDEFIGSIVWDNGKIGNRFRIAAETFDFRDLSSTSFIANDVKNIFSASIVGSGTTISGSTTSMVRTDVSASTGFYDGYGVKIIDQASGSAFRFISHYLSTSGTFDIDDPLPFAPASGSQVFILSQLDVSYGRVG